MKKIIFLILIYFCFISNVSAFYVKSEFEDVYISVEGVVHPISVMSYNDQYLYKIFLGEVTTNGYEPVSSDIIKFTTEEFLNNIVYQSETYGDGSSQWYYATQFKIFDYLFDDVYFCDSSGNKITYLSDEIEILANAITKKIYNAQTMYIFNKEVINIDAKIRSAASNLVYMKKDDGYSIEFLNGKTGLLSLLLEYNIDGETDIYANGDNNVLFAGGGFFDIADSINVSLKNFSTVDLENPPTGNNLFNSFFIILPSCIFIYLLIIVLKRKKYKKK